MFQDATTAKVMLHCCWNTQGLLVSALLALSEHLITIDLCALLSQRYAAAAELGIYGKAHPGPASRRPALRYR